jgi:hypothetical protein
MTRASFFILLAVGLVASAQTQQQPVQTPDLSTLLHQLPQTPEGRDDKLIGQIADHLENDPPEVVRAIIPQLVDLTEDPNDRARGFALITLATLGARQVSIALPGNTSPYELLLPYLPRLLPRLNDSLYANRNISLMLFEYLLALRPTPPSLLDALLKALEDPSGTQDVPNTYADPRPWPANADALGPSVASALLGAGAVCKTDPITQVVSCEILPAIHGALLQFLYRADQTPQSLAQTIHNLAISGMTEPQMNAELLPFPYSGNETVCMAFLQDLSLFRFPPSDVPEVKARLAQLASDQSISPALRAEAARVLPCWNNDPGPPMCPPMQINPYPSPQ